MQQNSGWHSPARAWLSMGSDAGNDAGTLCIMSILVRGTREEISKTPTMAIREEFRLDICQSYRTGTSFHKLFDTALSPHSSTLAWKIPWAEEPGRLHCMGSLRVGHDWATSLSCIGEGNGNPLQCSCLENPRDGGAWWAAVYGVTQSRTHWSDLAAAAAISL